MRGREGSSQLFWQFVSLAGRQWSQFLVAGGQCQLTTNWKSFVPSLFHCEGVRKTFAPEMEEMQQHQLFILTASEKFFAYSCCFALISLAWLLNLMKTIVAGRSELERKIEGVLLLSLCCTEWQVKIKLSAAPNKLATSKQNRNKYWKE